MPTVDVNGIEIYYEEYGSPRNPAVVFIPGLGSQLHYWTPGIVDPVVEAGFRAILLDNRDAGYSTHLDGARVNVFQVIDTVAAGEVPEVPYLLADMADDVAGLLTALEIEAAHIVGASMGGMIAQTFAIRHPERTLSLTSIMSRPGDAESGQATPEMQQSLYTAPPTEREAAIQATVDYARIAWADYFDEERAREVAARNLDRVTYPQGTGRQLAAIIASGDRTAALRELEAPTLVIHGEKDPLIDVSGGEATAKAIPGADLWIMPGVGHDLPPDLYPQLTERLIEHFRSGRVTPGSGPG